MIAKYLGNRGNMSNTLSQLMAYAGVVALARLVFGGYVTCLSKRYIGYVEWRFSLMSWLVYKVQIHLSNRPTQRAWQQLNDQVLTVSIWIMALAWPITLLVELFGVVFVWPLWIGRIVYQDVRFDRSQKRYNQGQ